MSSFIDLCNLIEHYMPLTHRGIARPHSFFGILDSHSQRTLEANRNLITINTQSMRKINKWNEKGTWKKWFKETFENNQSWWRPSKDKDFQSKENCYFYSDEYYFSKTWISANSVRYDPKWKNDPPHFWLKSILLYSYWFFLWSWHKNCKIPG